MKRKGNVFVMLMLLLLPIGFAGCSDKEENIIDSDGFTYMSSSECYVGRYNASGLVCVENHQCEMKKPCIFHNQSFEFFFTLDENPDFKSIYPNLKDGDIISFQIVKYKKPEIVLAVYGNLYYVFVEPCK